MNFQVFGMFKLQMIRLKYFLILVTCQIGRKAHLFILVDVCGSSKGLPPQGPERGGGVECLCVFICALASRPSRKVLNLQRPFSSIFSVHILYMVTNTEPN